LSNIGLKKEHQKLNFKIAKICDTIREQKQELKDNEELLDGLLKQRNELGE